MNSRAIKALALLFHLFCASMIHAQERTCSGAVGAIFSGVHKYGLGLRLGNDASQWRLNALYLSNDALALHGETESQIKADAPVETNHLGIEANVGKEFYMDIAHNISFIYGVDVVFSLDNYNRESPFNKFEEIDDIQVTTRSKYTVKTHQYGANVVLGCRYRINKILVGVEMFTYIRRYQSNISTYDITRLVYNGSQTKESETNESQNSRGFMYGFSSQNISIILGYSF